MGDDDFEFGFDLFFSFSVNICSHYEWIGREGRENWNGPLKWVTPTLRWSVGPKEWIWWIIPFPALLRAVIILGQHSRSGSEPKERRIESHVNSSPSFPFFVPSSKLCYWIPVIHSLKKRGKEWMSKERGLKEHFSKVCWWCHCFSSFPFSS